MSIISSLKDFMAGCPYLENMGRLNVNYLEEKDDAFSIEEVPTNTIIKTYVDGSTERQFVFVIASRLFYSNELANNLDNSELFENIEAWLETCTNSNELPTMPTGCTPYAIEAMSNGYLLGVNGDMTAARYQIQCRLLYDKE